MKLTKYLYLLILIALYLIVPLHPVLAQYSFESWTTNNGLPQNGIRNIVQTNDGYLWFATFGGLVRYDGIEFKTFDKNNTEGILNNQFANLRKDKNDTLWMAVSEAGLLTSYSNGVFKTYTSEHVKGKFTDFMSSDSDGTPIFLVRQEDDALWRYKFVDGQFVNFGKQGSSDTLSFKSESGVECTITKIETTCVKDGVTTTYPIEFKGEPANVSTFEDKSGTIWLGEEKVHRISNGKVETFSEKDGLPASDYHSFLQDSDGNIWVANGGLRTAGKGVILYKDGKFTSLDTKSGLSDNNVFYIFEDREGEIWLATNRGLNRIRRQIIKSFSIKDGLSDAEVYPIYRDSKNNIWIGTVTGLTRYRDGKFEIVKLNLPGYSKSQIDSNFYWIHSLWEDQDGHLWICADNKIYIYKDGIIKKVISGDFSYVSSITPDRAGNVWLTSNKGIIKVRNYEIITEYDTDDGLREGFFSIMHQDNSGRIWFGGAGGLTELRDETFFNYGEQEGFSAQFVRTFYEDSEGTLWIGTYGDGLTRYKDGKFSTIKQKDGLFDNGVFAIREDRQGNFWMSSNRGIYRVKKSELNDFADGKSSKVQSVSYGKEDGMLNNECNGGRQSSSIVDEDGNFWFPTQEGVSVVSPNLEKSNPLAPPAVIQTVTIENNLFDAKDGFTIEPDKNNLEIKYTGLSLNKSEQIQFKYRLVGHDKDWIEAGTRRTAYYSNLAPGNYTFEVVAANSDGIWNETPATITFEKVPFFYQTLWFFILCGFAVLLLIYGVYRARVYNLKRREKILRELVAEKTEKLKQVNKTLNELASLDALTGVSNRRSFGIFLRNEWNRAVRGRLPISLILIDIDHFKLYNDTYGHQTGDDCLKRVAVELNEICHRSTDIFARYGGEEFAYVLGSTDENGALKMAKKAAEAVRKLNIENEHAPDLGIITLSMGVATFIPDATMQMDELIEAADKALYESKLNGRNQITVADLSGLIAPPESSSKVDPSELAFTDSKNNFTIENP